MTRANALSRALGLPLLLLLAGMAMMTYALYDSGGSRTRTPKGVQDAATLAGFDSIDDSIDRDDAMAPAEPALSTAPLARLRAPRIGVDAPIEVAGLDVTGTMENPSGPEVVAWYEFSSRPGLGGNVVFAGHLDFANHGPAVFWRLRDLKAGDLVFVELADATSFVYKVVESRTYEAVTAPVREIVGPTEDEVITLITCAGTFDRKTRQYDKRLVVRAARS